MDAGWNRDGMLYIEWCPVAGIAIDLIRWVTDCCLRPTWGLIFDAWSVPPSSIFSGPSVHRLPMWLHKDCGLRSAAKRRESCVEGTESNEHLAFELHAYGIRICDLRWSVWTLMWSYWFWWKGDPVTIGERNCRRSHPGSINYGSFVLRLSLGLHKDCRLRFDCLHRANVMYVNWYSWHKAGTFLE